MGFRSVCIESRCKCSYSGGYLVVTKGDSTTKIHLTEISSLTFCTTQVYVSGFLMAELARSKIPVIFCDEKSYPIAESLPINGAHDCPKAINQQMEWSLPAKKKLWQRLVRDKIDRQAEVLKLLGHDREATVLASYRADVRSGDPTNREAAAASLYFSTLFGKEFNRDLDIPINACLNYGYSVLLSRVSREIVSRGYLTQVGICHRSEVNQWNFACDLMEPFRPFVDKTVLLSGIVDLNTDMKRLLIDMGNRTLSYRDGAYKANSVITLYVKDCLDCLNKEAFPDDIPGFTLL